MKIYKNENTTLEHWNALYGCNIEREIQSHWAVAVIGSIYHYCSSRLCFECDNFQTDKSQQAEIVFCRNICFYILKKKGLSLSKIGSFFRGRNGDKDHATVLNGIRKIECFIQTKDKLYYPLVVELAERNQIKIN